MMRRRPDNEVCNYVAGFSFSEAIKPGLVLMVLNYPHHSAAVVIMHYFHK